MAQANVLDRERVTYVGIEESAVGTRSAAMKRIHLVQGQGDIGAALSSEMVAVDDDRVIRFDNPQRVQGLKLPAWGALTSHLKGVKSADRLVSGATPAVLSQHLLLQHGLGRLSTGVGTTIDGGTSTVTELVVADNSNLEVGQIIFVELDDGSYEAATITALTSTTGITLREGLTSAPGDTNIVRGAYNFVPAESRTTTLSVEQKLTGTSGLEYRVLGGFGSLAFAFPDAFGKPITFTLTGVGCSAHRGPETLSGPSFGTSTPADDDMGPLVLHLPKLYLDTTITRASDSPYRIEKIALEMMSAPDPIPDPTQETAQNGFVDTAGRDNGVFAQLTLTVRMDTAEETIFEDGTLRAGLVTWDCNDGSIAALSFARAELVAKPQKVTLGSGRTGMTMVLNLLRDTMTAGGSSAEQLDLARASLRLAVG